MGYCINQVDSSFKILLGNQEAALQAVKAMPDKDYDWVKRGWFKEMDNISSVLDHWRYHPYQDDDGNIIDVAFSGDKIGQEFELFKVIAPFVEKDSFIEMIGEDGGRWRWIFDGNTCKEVMAKYVWE